MGSIPDRAGRLESVVSICILGILLLVAAGILHKQANMDMSRFGNDPAAAGVVQPQEAGQLPALSEFVPEGFKLLSQAEIYNPDNLYEKIDGKAPMYVDAGFERLLTQRFISEKDQALWLEVFLFDMAKPRNAYSVYSTQKRPDVETVPDIQFGYKTSNGFYFFHGKYYVEIVGSVESEVLAAAMSDIALQIRTHLAVGEDDQIAGLSAFAPEGKVTGSDRLYLEGAFGFGELTDIFVVQYKVGDESLSAFIGHRASSQDAQNLAERYYKFLLENGGVSKQPVTEALKALKVRVVDLYGTTEIIFAIGPFLAGIHEADNQKTAEQIAVRLADKLGDVAKTVSND